MKELLVPILLGVNLVLTGTVLGLGLTGNLLTVSAPSGEEELIEEDVADEVQAVFYHEFKPEIVVNFPGTGQPRYMQLSLTAVTADENAIASLALHAPAIRNDLLMLFSGVDPVPLATREGKDALRKQAVETIRNIMTQRYGESAVEDVYFTRFVMQ